jgi:hypothetical protein
MNCRVCGTELSQGTLFCGKCGSSVTATRVRPPAVEDPRGSDTSIVRPLGASATPSTSWSLGAEERHRPAVVGRFPGSGETAAPRIEALEEAPSASTATFTLSFSNGQLAEVSGSGLLGRRPITQPGETVDQIVAVDDPARSVSKTHLEFGIEAGELWICDRYSGNGTIAHPLGGEARLCEPGRRYRVTRGTRVEIGDQWFDVG